MNKNLSALLQHIQQPTNRTEAQRVFHGRGHAYKNLHHITIDWLPPVILITLFAPEPVDAIDKLVKELQSLFPECKSYQLQHRYQLQGPIDIVSGENIQKLIIQENKIKYQLQLGKVRNMGLFLDMKNGRQWVQNNSKNKRVLNLFSYTCGFSVAAIEGEARSVINIDMSSPALSVGRENHRLNNHSLKKVKFEKLNIFKSFGRIKKHSPYDLLICDPPTLQKGSVDIKKDYPKIMRRLNEFMAPQSSVLLCLNAPELNQDFIFNNMSIHAPEYKFIEEIKAPNVYAEVENKGLKVLHFMS